MARPYITLRIKDTYDGDSVTFYAEDRYLTFTCASADIQLFEYKANPTAASNNGAIFFQDDVAQSLSSDYEILRNQQIVTVRCIQDGNSNFDFGVVTLNNGGGSDVTVLDQGNADGTKGIVVTDDRVTPLQINSITHNVSEFYSPAIDKDFIYGNAGDIITSTVNFTTFKDGSVGRFDFRYGLLDNDTSAISTDTQTNKPYIPDNYFANFETNQIQSFSIDKATGDVSPNNPKNWQKDSITLNSLGAGVYEIVHTHYSAGFARTEDVSGNSLSYPDAFKGNKSMKYIFEISSKEDDVSTSDLENSTIGNAQTYFNKGNLGYNDEFLNGGSAKYTLGSFAWNNTENQLDYTQQTQAVVQLDTSGVDFTTATELVVKIQEINAISDESTTLLTNINEDRIKIAADGVPLSSSNILSATATVNVDPKKIDLVFDIKSYEYTSNYTITVAVSNDVSAINHENILLTVDVASAGVDTSDWVLSAYPSSSVATISLNPHYEMDITEAFNNLVGSVEDRALARWVFEDQSSDKVITKLKAAIKSRDGSQVFDTYEVTPDQIEDAGGAIVLTKGYILASGDPRNSLSVTKTGGVYTFDYAFQLWDSMVNVDDLVFSFTITGQQTLQTGETFNADKEWRTAILGYSINSNPTDYTNIMGYDLSRNEGTQADPKYLFESVSYSDLASGITLDSLGKNGTTKLDVVFAPDPSVLTTPPDIADINGYFGIRPCGGGQFEYRQFTTYESPEADSPFEDWDDSGNTTFLDKIIDGSDKVHLRANIDYDKLKLAYPDSDQFELSFRMDEVQSFVIPDQYLVIANTRKIAVEEIAFNTDALTGASVTALLLDSDKAEFDYEIDGVPQADFSEFQTNLGVIVGTDPISVTNTDADYIDSGMIISHETDFGNTQEIRYAFNQGSTAVYDIVVWFDREIQFSGATIPAAGDVRAIELSIREANPSGEDWTSFDYDDISTQLAAINADIVSAALLGPYAVHIKGNPMNNSAAELIMPFSFTDSGYFLDRIVYDAESGVDFQLGNGVTFEVTPGLGNCNIQIDSTTDTAVADLFDWQNSQPFTVSFWYNNNNTDTTGSIRFMQGLNNLVPGAFPVGLDIIQSASNEIYCQISRAANRRGRKFFNDIVNDRYIFFTFTYDGSQTGEGFKGYANAVPMDSVSNDSGTLNPGDNTDALNYRIGQMDNALFDDHVWKIRSLTMHDRVLTGEEIRAMHSDISAIPASGLVRNYDMSQDSPSWTSEVIYETVADQDNAVLDNHSNNRTVF